MAVDSLTAIHAALSRIGDQEWTLRELLVLARAGVFDDDPSEQELRDRIGRALPPDGSGWRDTREAREEHRLRVDAGLGKLRDALTPSDEFARQKQDEIAREDRGR
ncbi:hypothetical protein HN371_09815 [Candidatus Poribacteria bacterium]|jgi:hypothetical protein|nr:hypothetical protein [Candidatus Poribacteria bacterium]MBT5712919.1 hypothetical protein [Candidatus Poribacteria bacterium]MBT7096845.1 hypothetical protein [Candidatus Poribacteria bacterium]MBT7809451.1 hypothetical protein [Candidatus Poribacteria bacterium]